MYLKRAIAYIYVAVFFDHALFVDVQLLYILQNRLKTSVLSRLGSHFDPNDENAIENNLLKMDIYYKEFNFENIVEVPAYEVCVLACRFGILCLGPIMRFFQRLVM